MSSPRAAPEVEEKVDRLPAAERKRLAREAKMKEKADKKVTTTASAAAATVEHKNETTNGWLF